MVEIRTLTSGLRSPVTELQVTAYVFGLPHAFHLIAECLTVCSFSGSFFCTTYRFAVTRLWSNPPYFRNFDDVENTVARCFSPFSAKRYFSLPNTVEKRQIWLIR